MRRAVLPILAACIGVVWPLGTRPASPHELISTTVLFDREIVRILTKRCVGCHSENNLAFPLTTYEETRPWARAIEEEALRRHMPPWRAVPGYGQFANDNGLTLREFAFIVSWVEGNGPKTAGQTVLLNVTDAPKTPGAVAITPDFERWQLGEPDLQRPLATNTIAPGQPDEIRRVVVDLGLTSDRWVRALEFKPGDRRVVRAAFFVLQETGQWLGSWTPWYGVTKLPDGAAYRVPAGSHVAVELHYRGTGVQIDDRGTLGLYFADTPPANRSSDLVLEATGDVPANTTALKFRAATTLTADTNAVALRPNLFPGAQALEVAARRPDGGTQMLLYLKDPLPDWPTPYIFREPVALSKGTEIAVTSYYGNPDAKPRPGGVKLTIAKMEKNVRSAPAARGKSTGEKATGEKVTGGKALPRQSR
jgi:hypothetical protein